MVRSTLAALTALLAAPVLAQGEPSTKLYVSVEAGNSQNGVSQYAFGTPVEPRDEDSTLIRVRAGYQFVRFFALEAGYANLGSYRAGVEMDCSVAPNVECIPDFRSEIDLDAWTFNAAAQLPVGDRLYFRANLGVMARKKQTHQVPVEGDDRRLSSTKVLPLYGAGAGFAVTKRLDVFVEWSKFVGEDPGYGDGNPSPPGSVTDESDVEAFSLGARWRF